MFRPKRDANAETAAFPAGATAGIRPDRRAPGRLEARHPGAAFGPLKLRPVRHTAGGTVFVPGTTLTQGDGFAVADLAPVHRARWCIGEHYRTARRFLAAGSFRARSGRGVLQEPCASFVMVTATRLMTNGTGGETDGPPGPKPSRGPSTTSPASRPSGTRRRAAPVTAGPALGASS